MYELKMGTARLTSALCHKIAENPNIIAPLARLLDYSPEQLEQDIAAAQDYFDLTRENVEEW